MRTAELMPWIVSKTKFAFIKTLPETKNVGQYWEYTYVFYSKAGQHVLILGEKSDDRGANLQKHKYALLR